jgi:hypothetical protein
MVDCMIVSSSGLLPTPPAPTAVHDESIVVALEAIKSLASKCRTMCAEIQTTVHDLEVICRNPDDQTASMGEYIRIASKTADRIDTMIEQAEAEYQKVPSDLASESRRRLERELVVLNSYHEFAWEIVEKTERLVEEIHTRSRQLRIERESAHPPRLRYCIEVETPDITEEKVALINELLKSESIRRAMESAIASTSKYSSEIFKIKFVRDTSFLPTGSPGCMNWREGIMILNEGMLFRQNAKVFVFELFNAIQADRFLEIENQASAGRLSSEDYARAKEQVEFQTAILQHRVMEAACKELGWDPTGLTDDYAHYESLGFDRFWEVYQTTDHANYYRRDWHRCFSQFFFKSDLSSCALKAMKSDSDDRDS